MRGSLKVLSLAIFSYNLLLAAAAAARRSKAQLNYTHTEKKNDDNMAHEAMQLCFKVTDKT